MRPQTNPSASEISLGISRPRTRPREGDEQGNRGSMRIEPAEPVEPTDPLQPSGATLVEVVGQPRRKVSQIWSPHLWHDRRATGRRSMFIAPSLDEVAEGHAMSRRTAQIVLFTVGFVFPIGESCFYTDYLEHTDNGLSSLVHRLITPSTSSSSA